LDEEQLEELELITLLETGLSVLVKINATHPCVVLPGHLSSRDSVVLEIGYNLPVPIPDLTLDDAGITCTLSFNRIPFLCFIPLEAISGFGGAAVKEICNKNKKIIKKTKSGTPIDNAGKVIRPTWLKVIK
jgi:hypothetical protein